MVAISLYRGNLHRVSEAPRHWQSPSPKISLHNFKRLLSRRSSALSRHHFLSPNPNPNFTQLRPKLEPTEIIPNNLPNKIEIVVKTEGADENPINGPDELPEAGIGKQFEMIPNYVPKQEEIVVKTEGADENPINGQDELPEAGIGNQSETNDVAEALSVTEKKKKEIVEKLQFLNAKKHDLVQVLKQILSAEEELKRQSSTQGMGMRPSVPLQVDVTNDSGSLSRFITPRLNSDGNLASDTERGEADDTSHQNTHSRHLVRPSSISPSSDSLHRRPAFSAVPHPRANLGGVGSPSRFAPVGHPTNIPVAVATSGTSYIASSPSPAASGGTSAFRDNRQRSP